MTKRASIHLGIWFREKAREQAATKGTQQAARNLRKQGVPIDWAVDILARRGVQ